MRHCPRRSTRRRCASGWRALAPVSLRRSVAAPNTWRSTCGGRLRNGLPPSRRPALRWIKARHGAKRANRRGCLLVSLGASRYSLRARRRYSMLRTVSAAALSLALTASAGAQDFPTRPVTMVIPFAAGGPQDTIGRVIAQRASEILHQQVVIENVGGAGGTTGGMRVKNAAPDGYTFVLASVGTHAQSQTLYKKPPYNAVEDFTPVSYLGDTPIALIVRKDLPVNNLKEFIDYAKKNHDKMTYGSAGAGSATHLGCVVLTTALGVDITHVPYRGTGPAMQDLHGGRIDFLCEIINTAKPQIDGGTVKGLAIMSKQRSPVLPNLPTAAEQGVKNLEAYTWSAVFLPKGTPEPIVKKLNAAIVEAAKTPSVRERLQTMGAQVAPPEQMTPQYLGQFVKSEIEKWAVPIKASGVSAD